MSLTIDLSFAKKFLPEASLKLWEPAVNQAHQTLMGKSGAGNDFLGWLDLPEKSLAELPAILSSVREFSSGMEAVVVIGIGGSYLGTRAVTECLSGPLGTNRPGPEILYAGHHLHSPYFGELINYLKGKKWGIVVISKSGTTTEPAIAFRILRKALQDEAGIPVASKRIIAITDSSRGALRSLTTQTGYMSFVIPDDVGGRFSVFTPVGLVPVAIAGYDVEALLFGAREMMQRSIAETGLFSNPVFLYAATRNALLGQGKNIEMLSSFNPRLHYVIEWWKQLYGESEGKDGKGIFPAGADYTTDLHSMGQYMQDGPRNLMETVLVQKESNEIQTIPMDPQDLDGLNFLAGKTMDDINRAAETGTFMAHSDGGVPVIRIINNRYDEKGLGQLLYFFEKACAVSGYLLKVNPFDQPGVEMYKKNMFRLLKKPGY